MAFSVFYTFKLSKGWWVCSIDLAANDEADVNVLVNPKDDWLVQELAVTEAVQKHLGGQKLDSVLNMAGDYQVQSTLSIAYLNLHFLKLKSDIKKYCLPHLMLI